MSIAGLSIAIVGDTVTYPDGSEATIIAGAGAATLGPTRTALVSSHLSNGDRIIDSIQTTGTIVAHADRLIAGLLDPDYVPPLRTR